MDIKIIKTDIDSERIYTELQTFVVNEDKFQDQMDDSHLSVQICLQGNKCRNGSLFWKPNFKTYSR